MTNGGQPDAMANHTHKAQKQEDSETAGISTPLLLQTPWRNQEHGGGGRSYLLEGLRREARGPSSSLERCSRAEPTRRTRWAAKTNTHPTIIISNPARPPKNSVGAEPPAPKGHSFDGRFLLSQTTKLKEEEQSMMVLAAQAPPPFFF